MLKLDESIVQEVSGGGRSLRCVVALLCGFYLLRRRRRCISVFLPLALLCGPGTRDSLVYTLYAP